MDISENNKLALEFENTIETKNNELINEIIKEGEEIEKEIKENEVALKLIKLVKEKRKEYIKRGYSEFEIYDKINTELKLSKEDIKLLEKYDYNYPKQILLSELNSELIGKKLLIRALVVGEDVGKAIESRGYITCLKCKKIIKEINIKYNMEFFYQKIIKGFANSRGYKCSSCDGSEEIKVIFDDSKLHNYSILYIKELPENVKDSDTNLSTKIFKLYYFGIPKNVRSIELIGFIVRNPKTNDLELVSKDIRATQDEFLKIKVTKEEHNTFLKYFNNENIEDIIDNQIANHIVGRKFEKLSVALTLSSPLQIYDIYSRKIRGCLRTIFYGDTKTGKSSIGKDIIDYKIGELVIGETSSRAGLTYNINSDNRTIIWGALPLNDRKFVFIDGIHTLSHEEIEQMREALEQEYIKVSRMVSGERSARVRIIATLNPRKPMKSYYYKVQGLMDTVFRDPVDLTRWDIIIPFCCEDVEGNLISKSKTKERPITIDIFRKHIFWVWTLKPDDIRYTENAKEKIIKYANELHEFITSDYPIIHNGIRDTITRLSVAFACLYHSVVFDENGEFSHVEVNEKHVDKAREFIDEMIRRLDYDAFIYKVKEQNELSDDEFNEISEALNETEISILKYLVDSHKSSSYLASAIGLSDRSIREQYVKLRKFRLIETSHSYGAKLTTKGILYLKKLESKCSKTETKESIV
ncbi:MAG: hypothetical protein QXD43_03020 [Candidatus Aenigmatarchaeota archaeon]